MYYEVGGDAAEASRIVREFFSSELFANLKPIPDALDVLTRVCEWVHGDGDAS